MSESSWAQPRPYCQHRGFIEKLLQGLLQALTQALDAETLGTHAGLLQSLDPRAKLICFLALLSCGILAHSLSLLLLLFLLTLVLALASAIPLWQLAKQIWISVLLFTGLIALPALILVPGQTLWQLPLLHWSITEQGLRSAAFLIGRAETSATLAALLILSTPWPHLLKALRCLGAPVVLVAILGMTYRYIFVLLHTAMQMFEAHRSRIVAPMHGGQKRQMITAAIGVLLGKSLQLSTEVHLAMLARGYRGEVHLLHEFRLRPRDGIALLLALACPALIMGLQR